MKRPRISAAKQVTPRRQAPSTALAAVAALLLSLCAAPALHAQEEEEAAEAPPAPAPAANGLPIVVTGVQRMVQVREPGEQEWQAAEPGMMLSAGAEIRTGPRSAVELRIGRTQTVSVDRLGRISVLEAIEREGTIATEVGMQYGRTMMEIEAADGVEHDSRIRSPSATLALRSTRGFAEEYRRTLRAGVERGDVTWINARGQRIALPPRARVRDEQTSTAENRREEGTYNPTGLAATQTEVELFADHPTGFFEKAQLDFEQFRGQDVAMEQIDPAEPTNGNGIQFSNSFDFLAIFAEWDDFTDFGPLDFQLIVTNSLGETLSAENPGPSPSGGTYFGYAGEGGSFQEVVWPEAVPIADYEARVVNAGQNGGELREFGATGGDSQTEQFFFIDGIDGSIIFLGPGDDVKFDFSITNGASNGVVTPGGGIEE